MEEEDFMKRYLIFAIGIMVATGVFAQTTGRSATPAATPGQGTIVGHTPGAVSGFAPGAVSGFTPNAVSGFTPGAVRGFPPNAVQGLAAGQNGRFNFAPTSVAPLTAPISGNTLATPLNPNTTIVPQTQIVTALPLANTNRVIVPLF